MVAGLDKFKEYFGDFGDQYVIIGGAACHLWFDNLGIEFRVSKDIDMVLCVEVIDDAFATRLKEFLDDGGYEAREQGNGHREFFRFHKPENSKFPYMVELFARPPATLEMPDSMNVVRLSVEDDIVSLSAILLNEDYFNALKDAGKTLDGITVLDTRFLIPFKARAFLDLTHRKEEGDKAIKSDDIKKHKRDIIRLAQTLRQDEKVNVSRPLREDVQAFLDIIEQDRDLDPATFKVPLSRDEAFALLRNAYEID